MKTTLKVIGWTMLVGLGFSLLLLAGLVADGAVPAPFDDMSITFGEQRLALAQLQGLDWLLALLAVWLLLLLAIALTVLIVPATLLLPLLVVALALGAGLFAVVGVIALVLSPLWLMLWIGWRIARRERRRSGGAGATIAA